MNSIKINQKYTVAIWMHSTKIIIKKHPDRPFREIRETIPVDKIVLHPTFENYWEAMEAAKAVSMSQDVLFTEVFDVKTEKVIEKWTCGCFEGMEE